jgi:hypothetical protein
MSEQQSFCAKCGDRIFWRKTAKGKNTPVNLDGSTHWGTCPNAKDFKKRKL